MYATIYVSVSVSQYYFLKHIQTHLHLSWPKVYIQAPNSGESINQSGNFPKSESAFQSKFSHEYTNVRKFKLRIRTRSTLHIFI